MKHVLGTKIKKTDRLSKRLDWKVGVGKDNENQKLIKGEWIHSLAEIIIKEPEVDIIIKIKIAKKKTKK